LIFVVIFACHAQGVFAHEDDGSATISITDKGFEPKNLLIVVGTRVTWTNEDTKEHWPASNNHPTHTLYPGSGLQKCGTEDEKNIFDACHGLTPGESWSFTFTKAGEWSYHDHLFPSRLGTIHVFETDEERDRAATTTPQLSAWERFFGFVGNIFSGLLKKIGLGRPSEPTVKGFRALKDTERQAVIARIAAYNAGESWSYLKRVSLDNGTQAIDAHELAHIVGNALYQERGFAGIGVCDPTFAYGCYHGVTEKFLEDNGPSKTAEAAKTCKDIFSKDAQSQEYASCVHGLGHGLLTWYALDLNKALKACDAVPSVVQGNCYDGVFMEFSFSATKNQYPVDNPWAFCENLDQKYHIACARYQSVLMHSILGLDKKEIAKLCLLAGTSDLRDNCIYRLGFDAAAQYKNNPEGAAASCSALFSGSPRAQCISAVAEEFVFQEFPNWREASSLLCNTLSGQEKDTCLAKRDDTIRHYGR
jgi:plastocyanin